MLPAFFLVMLSFYGNCFKFKGERVKIKQSGKSAHQIRHGDETG